MQQTWMEDNSFRSSRDFGPGMDVLTEGPSGSHGWNGAGCCDEDVRTEAARLITHRPTSIGGR